MRKNDLFCPYCGAPVIMDSKGRGLCECCGQWIIYDPELNKNVLEDDYKRRHNGKSVAAGSCCVMPVMMFVGIVGLIIAGAILIF